MAETQKLSPEELEQTIIIPSEIIIAELKEFLKETFDERDEKRKKYIQEVVSDMEERLRQAVRDEVNKDRKVYDNILHQVLLYFDGLLKAKSK